MFENPAGRLGGVAVVWLQDHNCIVLKIQQELLVGSLLCRCKPEIAIVLL